MTPIPLRPRLVAALLIAGLGLPAGAQAAAGPTVSTAPGRVVFPADAGATVDNVDAGGASLATALPDASTLLIGSGAGNVLYAAKLGLHGALDRSFGAGGVTPLPTPSGAASGLLQLLRQPDGKLLLVGAQQLSTPRFAPPLLRVTRLNADATLDRSYGVEGTATIAVAEGCGACTTAALQDDGAVVLTGTTGEVAPPPAPLSFRWALTRLTPAGAVDRGFGSDGIVTIPTAISTSGFNVAIGSGGTIVTEAQSQLGPDTQFLLTRLTSSGAPDPTFAGGTPVVVPFSSGFLMLLEDDGSIVLNGLTQGSLAPGAATPAHQLLARYTAAGTPDPAFGQGGVVDLGAEIGLSQILPAAGHAVLVVGTPAATLPAGLPASGRLNVRLVAPDGTTGPALGRDIDLAFGGGGSSFVVSVKPRPVGSLAQNSFFGQRLVPRPDGSYLVPGAVRVSQPTGEGTGFSIGRFAAAALTPSLRLDTTFGGPAAPLRLSARVVRQRAQTARAKHGIRIVLKASAVGLARVKITHGGRAIAHSLLPIFTTTSRTLPVELTSYGNSYLRRHRNVSVSITATARDLLTTTATTTARGRLR
ncbi:MAG: hypothetical protein QOI78_6665 [Actinomycetota bacterium]|nr:hypothetical protein [Actinomycetota bacterium]